MLEVDTARSVSDLYSGVLEGEEGGTIAEMKQECGFLLSTSGGIVSVLQG